MPLVPDHSLTVRKASEADAGRGVTAEPFAEGVDGLYTETPELLLTVRYADCVPVLLCDLASGAVAAVHSGWKGTLGGIAARAAEKLAEISGGAGSIIAAIGPCARPCCYEVSDELYGIFTAADPENAAAFAPCRRGHYMLDMAKIIKRDLNRAGVPDERISDSGICTICGGDDFFSHRVSGENAAPWRHLYKRARKGAERRWLFRYFTVRTCTSILRFRCFRPERRSGGGQSCGRVYIRSAFCKVQARGYIHHFGDLFDGELVTRDTCELLRSQFESFRSADFSFSRQP